MEFTSPVGRLVQGSCFKGQTHDNKGQPYVIKTGPNAGQPMTKYFFAVAFPKLLANGQPNEEFNVFYRNVIDVARAAYPQFFNGQIDPFTGKPGCTHPRMTYKISDGDGMDANGTPNNTKEGFAGHWVVKFGGMYPPKCFELGKFAPEQRIQDESRIKTGYYVAVSGTCDGNIGSDVPGVYMNGNLVCLIGAGPEIVGGPDANAAFSGLNVAALPPGCVVGATPASAPVVQQPVMPVVQQPVMPVVQQPVMPVVQQPVAAPLTPNMQFVANAGAVAPTLPPLPVLPVGIQLNAAATAQGYTLEMFRAQNWTDDMIRQGGFAA